MRCGAARSWKRVHVERTRGAAQNRMVEVGRPNELLAHTHVVAILQVACDHIRLRNLPLRQEQDAGEYKEAKHGESNFDLFEFFNGF